jgi:hypothetical protein
MQEDTLGKLIRSTGKTGAFISWSVVCLAAGMIAPIVPALIAGQTKPAALVIVAVAILVIATASMFGLLAEGDCQRSQTVADRVAARRMNRRVRRAQRQFDAI